MSGFRQRMSNHATTDADPRSSDPCCRHEDEAEGIGEAEVCTMDTGHAEVNLDAGGIVTEKTT